MKSLLVNGRFLTQPVTGVQRYCIELMRQLDALTGESPRASGIKITCLAPAGPIRDPGWKNISIRPVGLTRGNAWEQLDLPMHLKGELLFSPANIGPCFYRKQVVMLHDASVFAVPAAYSPAFRAKYVFIFHQLALRARGILTNSNFSQSELAHHLNLHPGRLKVIPLGADHLDRLPPDESILHTHHLEDRSYFLLVASLSPHKNIRRVLEAVRLIDREVRIVLVRNPVNRRVFRDADPVELPENVLRLAYLEDAQLRALYEHALGLIFPSTYEGFGLPVLEAMHCGCPVLCAKTASLPEVAGEAALYFDPLNSHRLAETVNTFLRRPDLQEELRRKGIERAARYTWADTARKTLDFLLATLDD